MSFEEDDLHKRHSHIWGLDVSSGVWELLSSSAELDVTVSLIVRPALGWAVLRDRPKICQGTVVTRLDYRAVVVKKEWEYIFI